MYLLKRNIHLKTLCRLLRLYSSGRQSHYETLNLRRNCSDKEIKEAFIQLSKEFHPDINKSAKAQEHFVRIVEAYNVLGKPGSRARYDYTTEVESGGSYVYKTHVPYNLRKNPNYGYYSQQKSESESTNRDYYGIRGLKKLPNIAIIMICFGIAAIGVFLQVVVIRLV